MKILQIGKYYYPQRGGIETITKSLCDNLYKFGFQCDVVCFNNKNKTEVSLHDGIKVIKASTLFTIKSMPVSIDIFTILRAEASKYDIIHIHLPNPWVVFCFLFIKTRAKIVVHWHSDIVKQRLLKLVYLPFERLFLRSADIIVGTTWNYVHHSSQLQKFAPKLRVIPLGIEIRTKFKCGIETNPKRCDVLSVGRLVEYKGFSYLIQAMQLLSEEYHLTVIGDGPLRNSLQAIIHANNLQNRVRIIPGVNDNELQNYYCNCTIFCLPSITKAEAFGVVQLEAMSYGKPIVSTFIPNSGIHEVNIDGLTGRIVAPKNPAAIAGAIQELYQDVAFYSSASEACYKRANIEFDSNVMASRFKRIYKELTTSQ